jgi:hypothetical protein
MAKDANEKMERTGGEPDVVGQGKNTGEFDTKTSSWVKTPAEIRKLGGALYCDRRYGRVFVGYNGAQSYYSGRSFPGLAQSLKGVPHRPI